MLCLLQLERLVGLWVHRALVICVAQNRNPEPALSMSGRPTSQSFSCSFVRLFTNGADV
jgi:hypothetical protein